MLVKSMFQKSEVVSAVEKFNATIQPFYKYLLAFMSSIYSNGRGNHFRDLMRN